ncbi:MAG TPA: IclR family transcriptional regulator [Pseudonocardia sp.]|nr:IclR family transcriptional regulator [Pseudonocardia sp.]
MADSESAGTRTEGAETARRALRLIEAVVTAGKPVGLVELAGDTGLSKSTCYRLLRVLQDELYLDRAESGGYRVGSRLVGVAAAVLPQADRYAAARPALRELAATTGETATLHVRSGARAVLVLGVESADQVLRRAATVGESTPLTSGCSGRAILATLRPGAAQPIIDRAEDPAVLRVALDEIRRAGYALSYGANHPGVHGMAAPVRSSFERPGGSAVGPAGGPAGGPALSVAVSGPAARWTEGRMRTFADRLLDTCAELSELLDDRAEALTHR